MKKKLPNKKRKFPSSKQLGGIPPSPLITEARVHVFNEERSFKDLEYQARHFPKYYQDGGITDPLGQWAHPGQVTTIPSNQITMKGVNYPVLGISDVGDKKMMLPGKDYQFKGKKVVEYPMQSIGKSQTASGGLQLGGNVEWQIEDEPRSKQSGGRLSFDNYYNTIPKDKADTSNYDLRRAYSELPYQQMHLFATSEGHLPDTYKLPNHPTFSNESIYYNQANKDSAGHWQETPDSWMYVPYNPTVKDTVVERKGLGGKITWSIE